MSQSYVFHVERTDGSIETHEGDHLVLFPLRDGALYILEGEPENPGPYGEPPTNIVVVYRAEEWKAVWRELLPREDEVPITISVPPGHEALVRGIEGLSPTVHDAVVSVQQAYRSIGERVPPLRIQPMPKASPRIDLSGLSRMLDNLAVVRHDRDKEDAAE